MRFMKITILVTMLLIGFAVFEQTAEAHSSVFFGFSTGYHHYYRPYYYRPYYGPFYNPYFYQPYYYYPYYSGYYPRGYHYGGYGEIRAEVKPQSARVYIDGDYVGVADDYDGWWQRLDLEPGKHRIVFRAPGFVPYAVTMRILPGQDYHIKYQMQPGQDLIDEREMRLPKEEYERERHYSHRDDRYDRPDKRREYEPRREDEDRYGHDDRSDRRYEPPPPPERPGYEPREEDQGGPGPGGPEPGGTNLTLQIRPDDATVYIDGNYYGTADVGGPGEIQVLLPAGTHKVEVVRPGYDSYSRDIVVDEKSPKKIQITLHKKGE